MERSSLVVRLQERRKSGGKDLEERPPPGDARHVDSEDPRARPAAWLGDLAAHPADFRRRAAGESGLAVSRAAPARRAGPDRRGVGRVGRQSPGEVLQPHSRRTEAARRRSGAVGAYHGGRRACARRHRVSGGPMTRLVRRLRTLTRRSRVKDDIRRELDFHIEMEADKRQRQGMSADEARRTALRDFGGMSRVREEVHDTRGLSMWDAVTQDVRFSLRMLRRWPGYTAAVIFTLALGIGANTAIFSIVDNVLLEPLPYAEPQDLVRVVQSRVRPVAGETNVSIKELFDYREGMRSLDGLVEYHFMSFVLLNHGEPDRVDTGVVSSNYFDVFGVRPIHGRGFLDKDDDLGAEAVVLLSHAYWQKKFGGDAGVVGRAVEMNDKPHTIVGVLPPIPQYPRENDVYMPTSACPFRAQSETLIQQNRRAFSALQVFGRL